MSFPDTSCSRKSFSRIVISANVFFSNRRLAEHYFAENAFSQTNSTIKSKRPYREFQTLRILTVSMSKLELNY